MEKNTKVGIALFSGGLDSILAIKLMERAGFKIIPLFIYTPFHSKRFPEEIKDEFSYLYGKDFANNVIIHETGKEYLDLVRSPKYGYGKNLNPCIDCKIFFLKVAKMYMQEYGASFVVTGEVLGQRGMSQRKEAILKIEKQSGLSGRIIRPLSLNFFPKTHLEKGGFIKPSMFLSIRGRGRIEQLKLAQELGVKRFPQPAGGCLLTDPEFSRRVRVLIKEDLFDTGYIHAVKYGRLIVDNGLYVVARNDRENHRLMSVARKYKVDVFIPEFKGPVTAVLKGKKEVAEKLSCKYTRHCKL